MAGQAGGDSDGGAKLVQRRARERQHLAFELGREANAHPGLANTEALRGSQRRELGALAYHHVRPPLLDHRQHVLQRRARVQTDVELRQSAPHRLRRRQARLAGPKPGELVVVRLGERPKREARPLRRRRRAGLTRHQNLVAGPETGLSERHQRAKVTRVRSGGKKDTHGQPR